MASDIDQVFRPTGYFAEKEGIDRYQFEREQKEQIELGLFRMIFWHGVKPEDIRISSHSFRGMELYYFAVDSRRFLPPQEVRVVG